jgi:hypothetical protein
MSEASTVYALLFQGEFYRGNLGRFSGHGSAIAFLIETMNFGVSDVIPDFPKPGCQTYALGRGMFAVLYSSGDRGLLPITHGWMDELILAFHPPQKDAVLVNGLSVDVEPALAVWMRRYPVLTEKANARANMWEYVLFSMLTIPRGERVRLWLDVGQLNGFETMEEVLRLWLSRHAAKFRQKNEEPKI